MKAVIPANKISLIFSFYFLYSHSVPFKIHESDLHNIFLYKSIFLKLFFLIYYFFFFLNKLKFIRSNLKLNVLDR